MQIATFQTVLKFIVALKCFVVDIGREDIDLDICERYAFGLNAGCQCVESKSSKKEAFWGGVFKNYLRGSNRIKISFKEACPIACKEFLQERGDHCRQKGKDQSCLDPFFSNI